DSNNWYQSQVGPSSGVDGVPSVRPRFNGISESRLQQVGIDSKGFFEFFDCLGSQQGVEDLREGVQGDREVEVFQVSNDDTVVAQRRLKDKKPEEKTNTDCLSSLSKVFWAEDTTRSTYLVDWSSSSAIGFKKLVDMLGFFGWLASSKQGMLEPVKVKCMFLVYHKSIVGTGSMQVLHGFDFVVEPLGDHTFEVKPHENVDQGYGLQEAEIWATKGLLDKAKGNVLCMEIVRYQSGNTLRVSQSRFYNEKLEYQMVCTGLDIASADVGSLKANLQHMKALATTKARYMTFTDAKKKKICLKGLLIESIYELRLVAGIATSAFVKGGSRFEVPAQVKVAAYRY
nr:hypothetical protein [Tanacetum cinerariifolium]GEY73773.1 hypothetical protein [Tanacetum cinerariifolium]